MHLGLCSAWSLIHRYDRFKIDVLEHIFLFVPHRIFFLKKRKKTFWSWMQEKDAKMSILKRS